MRRSLVELVDPIIESGVLREVDEGLGFDDGNSLLVRVNHSIALEQGT